MQIVKTRRCAAHASLRVAAMIACALLGLGPGTGRTQISPQEASQLRAQLGTRVEALTILGGDFGLSDGRYKSTESDEPLGNRPDSELSVTKIGGWGDVGDPQPLGNSGIGWQPRLQGNVGWLTSTLVLLLVFRFLVFRLLRTTAMQFMIRPTKLTSKGPSHNSCGPIPIACFSST